MELTMREQRMQLLSRRLADIAKERNDKTIGLLARAWKLERGEVRSSFNFTKYMLFDYKINLNRESDNKSFDEIYITFEQSVFCDGNTLLSFSFHIFDEDIQLVGNFDESFSDDVYERATTIIKNFLTKELGIPE